MNLNFVKTKPAQKIGDLFKLIFIVLISASCTKKSQLSEVNGDIQVKIPIASQNGNSSQYRLEVVTLKGISSLKEVTGFFVKFFFSPGLNQNELTGDSPQARFIRTSQNIFIPSDSLSQQMATLYYHIQNLSEFSQRIGAGEVNQAPMKIGIETNVSDSDGLTKNNAFYDGHSDAMLFVPFTSSELPIAVNSGIIAHEYFHSLFYKIVMKNLDLKASTESDSKLQKLYNETYLRGINEGLADFWGWAYTNDDDFIRWSLSKYSKNRKLVLSEQAIGQFEGTNSILKQAEFAMQQGPEPSHYLSEYIYKIGTPNAIFLKQLTTLMIQEGASVANAKLQMAKAVLAFIKKIALQAKQLKGAEILSADALFNSISADSKIKFTQKQCEFSLNYNKKNKSRAEDVCVLQADESYQIGPKTHE